MRFSRNTGARGLLMLVLACLLAACAAPTPYGQNGLLGGYTDEKLEPHMYRVTFRGNGHTSEDMVVKYWLYRCAELTLKNGYGYFGLLGSPRTSSAPESDNLYDLLPKERQARQAALQRPAVFDESEEGWAMVPVKSAPPTYIYVPSYSSGRTITTWRKTGTIVMYHSRVGAVTPEQAYALHAQTVIDMLKPFVQSGGKDFGPSRQDVIDTAAKLSPVPAGQVPPAPSYPAQSPAVQSPAGQGR